MSSQPVLSIVSPVFLGRDTVAELVDRVLESARRATDDFEVILVDDGSPDGSWERISKICDVEPRVKGVRLTRNFGQQNAITAGLVHARGAYVVVLDCDLQDDPRYIPDLLAEARRGYDVVLTQKRARRFGRVRNGLTQIYYLVLKLTGDLPDVDARTGEYALISRRVVDAFLHIADYRRDFLLLVQWMGFKHALIPVEHMPRLAGKSSYTWSRLVHQAVADITSNSKVLLKISIGVGFAYVVASFVAAVYLVVGHFVHGYRAGWASTMVILLASTGMILLAVGIVGIYIGNIFDQVRGRPLFFVQERVNFDAGEGPWVEGR